ncbi:GNAT family N-acetyltransferase [Indiicoccus explosivorum]|uniref:GNAT family N-acetyltransferase n=1 Tax=Indiicoccus explosivorum TaxID=1917864 RepID=UPI000B4444B4|nr:GNAT family N-acetyltransferase [Indiicoccus explosivorum]
MIQLRGMTAEEFDEYLSHAIPTYAEEHVRSGRWTKEESLEKSRQEYAELLPDGKSTEGNYLYTVTADEPVGMIWLNQKQNGDGFIFDIYIWEQHQGKGYGKRAMQLIEETGRELGMEKIGLHVFGHNKTARALYEKLGYETMNVIMSKNIKG